jgi:hypothetical protein
MGKPGFCPHCDMHISPWRLLRVSRRISYKCPTCGGESLIPPRSGKGFVVAFVTALALPLFLLDYFGVERVAIFAVAVIGALATPIVFARICRFEPKTPARTARSGPGA